MLNKSDIENLLANVSTTRLEAVMTDLHANDETMPAYRALKAWQWTPEDNSARERAARILSDMPDAQPIYRHLKTGVNTMKSTTVRQLYATLLIASADRVCEVIDNLSSETGAGRRAKIALLRWLDSGMIDHSQRETAAINLAETADPATIRRTLKRGANEMRAI